MKNKMLLAAAAAAMLWATSGCSNGPLSRFFRGNPCNSCQPAMGSPCSNMAGSCADGSCGTGVYDQNPASIPGTQLGTTGGEIYYNDPTGGIPSGDAYGNTGVVTPPTIGPMNGN